MGVGVHKYSDYVISHDSSEYNLPAMSFVLAHRESQEIARFTANVWGKHNALPLAIAGAAGRELGLSLKECADSLRDFQALPGRGRVIFVNESKFIVDDAYNANPASMGASLSTFAKVKTLGKIAVLGEMRELGENSAKAMTDVYAAKYIAKFRNSSKPDFDWMSAFEKYLSGDKLPAMKKTKSGMKEIDMKHMIFDYKFLPQDESVELLLSMSSLETLKPTLLFEGFFNSLGKEFATSSFELHRLDIFKLVENGNEK